MPTRLPASRHVVCLFLLLVATPLSAAPRWTALGPFGGGVGHLTADPTAPRTLYAVGGGIFKTIDDGATWAPIHAVGGNDAVAIDPSRPATIYVTASPNRILKSTDGGAHWTESSLNAPCVPGPIAVDPVRPNRVYLGCDGVWRSIDGGVTWRPAPRPVPAGQARLIVALVAPPRPAGTIYAATGAGVFKSVDAGLTWRSTSQGLPAGGAVSALAMAPSNPRILWAAVSNAGIYRSTNGGASWRRTAGQPFGGHRVFSLTVSPRAPWTAWIGADENEVSRTTDAGAHWTLVRPRAGARVFAVAATPDTLYAGLIPERADPGGILASEDGGASWQPRNRGLSALGATDLAIDPRDPQVLWEISDARGFFRSGNRGQVWHSVLLPRDDAQVSISSRVAFSADGTDLYLLDRLELWTSGNDGISWSLLLGAGIPTAPSNPTFFLAHPQVAADLYAGHRGALYASHDGGAHWNSIWPGFQCTFTTLAPAPSAPSVLYAAGTVNADSNIVCRRTSDVLSRSTDGGASWSAADSGLPGHPRLTNFLVVDHADSQTLYVGLFAIPFAGANVWKSTNGGASWLRASPGPGNTSVTAFAISPLDGALWAGAQVPGRDAAEVFVSRDGGATWTSADGPLTHTIHRLVPDPDDPDRLYAVTGGGVWMLENDEP